MDEVDELIASLEGGTGGGTAVMDEPVIADGDTEADALIRELTMPQIDKVLSVDDIMDERFAGSEKRRQSLSGDVYNLFADDVSSSAALQYPSYLGRLDTGDSVKMPVHTREDEVRNQVREISALSETVKAHKYTPRDRAYQGKAYPKQTIDMMARRVKADWIPEYRFIQTALATGDFTKEDAERFRKTINNIDSNKEAMDWIKKERKISATEETARELSLNISKALWQPENGVARMVYSGIGQALVDLGNLPYRVLSPEMADEHNRIMSAFEVVSSEMDEDSILPQWFLSAGRSATRSLTTATLTAGLGEFGVPFIFAATRYNQAVTEGRDAGLSTSDIHKYAARAAAIEGGIALAFSAAGAGGFEKMMTKGVTATTMREMFKQTGVSLLQELPEEIITEIVDNVNQKLSGIDEDALTLENLWNTIRQTVISTVLSVGVGGITSHSKNKLMRHRAGKRSAEAKNIVSRLPVERLVELAAADPTRRGMKNFQDIPDIERQPMRVALVEEAGKRIAEMAEEEAAAESGEYQPVPGEEEAEVLPEQPAQEVQDDSQATKDPGEMTLEEYTQSGEHERRVLARAKARDEYTEDVEYFGENSDEARASRDKMEDADLERGGSDIASVSHARHIERRRAKQAKAREVQDDSQAEGRVLRSEPQGEELGRPVPEQVSGEAETEPSGVLQEPTEVREVKEPWQMRREEYRGSAFQRKGYHNEKYGLFETDYLHRAMVKKALADGKPVPAEVLADYPDLQKKPAQAKEPWEMRREEYRASAFQRKGYHSPRQPKYLFDDEKFIAQVERVGRHVIERVGSSDPQSIVDYYDKKYALGGLGVEYLDLSGSRLGGAWMATTKPGAKNPGFVIDQNAVKDMSPEQIAGALRHEIEHYKDQIADAEGEYAELRWHEGNLALTSGGTLQQAIDVAAKGHHEKYGLFETDYLHRAMVKKALKEGKPVPPEVLADYPDLQSKVAQPSTPVETAQKAEAPARSWEGFGRQVEGIDLAGEKDIAPEHTETGDIVVYHGTSATAAEDILANPVIQKDDMGKGGVATVIDAAHDYAAQHAGKHGGPVVLKLVLSKDWMAQQNVTFDVGTDSAFLVEGGIPPAAIVSAEKAWPSTSAETTQEGEAPARPRPTNLKEARGEKIAPEKRGKRPERKTPKTAAEHKRAAERLERQNKQRETQITRRAVKQEAEWRKGEPVTLTPDGLLRYSLRKQQATANAAFKEGERAGKERGKEIGERRGKLLGALSLQATQLELLDYAKDTLPSDEYRLVERALAKLPKTRTPSQVKRFIAAVNKMAAIYQRKELVRKIKLLKAKAKKAGLRPEYQAKLDDLIEGFALSNPTKKSIAAAMGLFDAAAADEIGEIPRTLINKAIATLNRASLAEDGKYVLNMEAGDLADIVRAIESVIHFSERKNRLSFTRKRAESDKLIKRAAADVRTVHGEKEGRDRSRRDITKKTGAIRRTLGVDQLGMYDTVTLASGESGVAHEVLYDNMVDSREKDARYATEAEDTFRQWMADNDISAEDIESMSEAIHSGAKEKRRVDRTTFEFEREGNHRPDKVGMTIAEQAEFYATMLDPRNRETLFKNKAKGIWLEGSTRPVHITARRAKQITDAFEKSSPGLTKLVRHAHKYMNTVVRARVNETSMREMGVELFPAEDRWSIRRRPTTDKDPSAGVRRWGMVDLAGQGFFKEFKGSTEPILIDDFFSKFAAMVHNANAYAAKATAVADARRVIAPNSEYSQAVRESLDDGDLVLDNLRDIVNDFEGMSPPEKRPGLVKLIDKIIRGAQVGLLAIKPYIPIYQRVSSLLATTEIEAKFMWRGQHQKDADSLTDTELHKHAPSLSRRGRGSARQVISPALRGNVLKHFVGSKQTRGDRLMSPIHTQDMKVIRRIWRAAKSKGFDMGLTGQELMEYASKEAHRVVDLTQPTWDALTVSRLVAHGRTDSAARVLTLFAGQRQKISQIVFRSVARLLHKHRNPNTKLTKGDVGRAALNIANATIINASLLYAIKKGYWAAFNAAVTAGAAIATGTKPVWRDESDDDEKMWVQALFEIASRMAGGYMGFDIVARGGLWTTDKLQKKARGINPYIYGGKSENVLSSIGESSVMATYHSGATAIDLIRGDKWEGDAASAMYHLMQSLAATGAPTSGAYMHVRRAHKAIKRQLGAKNQDEFMKLLEEMAGRKSK